MLVQHFLENSAKRMPDKVALICGNERLTYQEINSQSDNLAVHLVDLGIKPQDRVVIFLDNTSEAVISLFGILKAGAVFLMLNPGMKAKKLNYILKDSGAAALIGQTNKFHIIEPAVDDAINLKHIIQVGNKNKFQKEISSKIKNHDWNEILSLPHTSNCKPSAATLDCDLATIIYTSGSTGLPKGVMSAHSNMVAAAESITTYLANVEEDIILNTLQLSFDYGLYQVLMAFMFGGTVVLEKSFAYAYKIIERLIEEKVTGFPIVPTILAILLRMDDLSKFDFSSLRYISNTAAALPVSHIQKFQQSFPNIKLYSMYGLTECKRVSYLPPEYLDQKPDSVGIPMPGVEVSIINEEGEEMGPGEIGEIVVRGPNVMKGYWKDPEETAQTFRESPNGSERVLHTGDLFKKDEDGFLYFVSRKDDLIKTKGERISPKEIENELCQMESVSEAAVIGVSDEILGQAIKVFIVTNPEAELLKADVMRYCQQNLEPFMMPKYVEFRKSLPKLSNGKINKRKLV